MGGSEENSLPASDEVNSQALRFGEMAARQNRDRGDKVPDDLIKKAQAAAAAELDSQSAD